MWLELDVAMKSCWNVDGNEMRIVAGRGYYTERQDFRSDIKLRIRKSFAAKYCMCRMEVAHGDEIEIRRLFETRLLSAQGMTLRLRHVAVDLVSMMFLKEYIRS